MATIVAERPELLRDPEQLGVEILRHCLLRWQGARLGVEILRHCLLRWQGASLCYARISAGTHGSPRAGRVPRPEFLAAGARCTNVCGCMHYMGATAETLQSVSTIAPLSKGVLPLDWNS